MMVNCGYTMPSKYSMKFLGEHLGTYYIGRVWLARGCSINPTLQTHFFLLVLFKTHPTNSHSDPFQENPKGKYTKNQVIIEYFQMWATTAHGPISSKAHGKMSKKTRWKQVLK
jgi:hypothetical protein